MVEVELENTQLMHLFNQRCWFPAMLPLGGISAKL